LPYPKEGTKYGQKRHKQRPQWIMVMADYDDDNDMEEGGSGVEHVVTAAHNGKCQAQSPTYHFERLLEGACLNHAYPIKHKLKDYNMMKNFMISGSLTEGMELDEDSGESYMMPFPWEETVMTVYDGCPHQKGTM
jgi:hypothetical protein